MKINEDIVRIIRSSQSEVLDNWLGYLREDKMKLDSNDLNDIQSIFEAFMLCLEANAPDLQNSDSFNNLKETLLSFTSFRAINNFTPTETANYILKMKPAIFTVVERDVDNTDISTLIRLNEFVDEIVLISFQNFCDSREEIILSQAYALEHDTPLVEIARDVVLMPIIGIIDTTRAQKIIETLLSAVVEKQSLYAILDMTGVPTFDTHVASNILKTVLAAKMVGTHVILSGISSDAALTIVKLGLQLDGIDTFSTLEKAVEFTRNNKR